MEKGIRYIGKIDNRAWFSVHGKVVSLSPLVTETFEKKDVDGLKELFLYYNGEIMDSNNVIFGATKEPSRLLNMVKAEIEDSDECHTFSHHIKSLKIALDALEHEGNTMLALDAAILTLKEENDG